MLSRSWFVAAIVSPLCLVGQVPAFAAPVADYNIPSIPLDEALLQLGIASGRQIVFAPATVAGQYSRPVRGKLQFMAAMRQMLPPELSAQTRGGLVVVRTGSSLAAPRGPPADARSTSTPEASTPIETLVVTALKFETLMQRTPVSISLASGLGDRGETSLNDFYRRIPGLTVTTNGTSQQRLAIRGVRGVGEATAGLYYDETPVTGPAGSAADSGSTQPELNLFDVQRIEVLRGPQGTLYGAGSMGGTVRVIFNKPDAVRAAGRVELRAGATASGAPTTSLRAVANMPLAADKLAARLVVYGENDGGFVDSVRFSRQDVNSERSRGVRASAAFTPAPTVDISVLLAHQDQRASDISNFWSPGIGRYKTDVDVPGRYAGSLDLASITAEWETPVATLLVTSSHYRWNTLTVSDYSNTLARAAADPAACGRFFAIVTACDPAQSTVFGSYAGARIPGAWEQRSRLRSQIEEVRAGSPSGGTLGWTVGFFREARSDHFDSTVYRADAATGAVQYQQEITGYRTIDTRVRQEAVFGEATVRPAPGLSLTGGVRRFSYHKTVGGEVFIPNRVTGSTITPYREVMAHDQGWVTKLSASFEPAPHSLFYATRSEGFRPGGANNVPGAGAEVPESYGPDSLSSYELGSKIGLKDGRITINSAAYLIDWRDMQVSAQSTNGAWIFNSNAGRARIIGGELETVATPGPNLWLLASVAYTDARLVEDQRNSFGAATGQAGDRIPLIPRWTGAASVIREGRIGPYRTSTRLDYSYVSSAGSQFQITSPSYANRPGYSLVDVQFTMRREAFEISARVTNALNVVAPQAVQASPPQGGGRILSARPRTLTFALSRSF